MLYHIATLFFFFFGLAPDKQGPILTVARLSKLSATSFISHLISQPQFHLTQYFSFPSQEDQGINTSSIYKKWFQSPLLLLPELKADFISNPLPCCLPLDKLDKLKAHFLSLPCRLACPQIKFRTISISWKTAGWQRGGKCPDKDCMCSKNEQGVTTTRTASFLFFFALMQT